MLSMLMKNFQKKTAMVEPAAAPKGRDMAILSNPQPHAVTGRSIVPPFPQGFKQMLVGMGCFWGAERIFWQTEGVWVTSVGYAGGYTKNPTYGEVCTATTGHAEVVEIVYDPDVIDTAGILKIFWENHDPTQGMRQGNDVGTQYRSAIFVQDAEMLALAEASLDTYNAALTARGLSPITTEIAMGVEYFLAEDDHQQYLHKVPHGYCGIKGTGVVCSI